MILLPTLMYPVYVEEVAKTNTDCLSTNDVVARLRANVEPVAGATLIGVFDHQSHVAAHPEGQIAPEIKTSKHVIFCLSNAIPNPLIAAVRPRAISVVELEERFVISFLEAPVEGPNQVMAG